MLRSVTLPAVLKISVKSYKKSTSWLVHLRWAFSSENQSFQKSIQVM